MYALWNAGFEHVTTRHC